MTNWWQIGDISMKLLKNLSWKIELKNLNCQKNCDTNLLTNIPEMSTKSQLERQQRTIVTKLLTRIPDLSFHVNDDLMLVTISEIDDEIYIWWHFNEVGTQGKRMMTLSPKKLKLSPTFWQIAYLETIIIFGSKFETHHYEMVNGEAQR